MLRALASLLRGWWLALLSQPEAAAVETAGPIEYLTRSSDPLDHWIGVQCSAIALAYLGRADEMAAQLEEAIIRVEPLEQPFWVSSMRTWRSFAALLSGDLEGVTTFAESAMEGVAPEGEYWVTVWNLWLLALAAAQDDRPDDAIELYAKQVARCREISYVRGTVVSMEGLGEANVAAGRLDAAAAAFIEGIASAERMGMVGDVLSMMTKTAGVRALQGRSTEAVELLATVLAEPASSGMPFSGGETNIDAATAALGNLETEMEPTDFAAASARGSARPYEVAAKELLNTFGGSESGEPVEA